MTICCYFLFCQSVGLLFYSPSISLQLIFGVSCTLTRRQTCPGRRTSSALPPFHPPAIGQRRQMLWLRLKFVGKLKTLLALG